MFLKTPELFDEKFETKFSNLKDYFQQNILQEKFWFNKYFKVIPQSLVAPAKFTLTSFSKNVHWLFFAKKYLNESFFQSLDFELVFLRRFQSNFPQNKILAAKWLKHERLNRRKKRNDNKFDFCSFLVVKIAITARDWAARICVCRCKGGWK